MTSHFYLTVGEALSCCELFMIVPGDFFLPSDLPVKMEKVAYSSLIVRFFQTGLQHP